MSADVYTPARRKATKGIEHLDKASKLAEDDPARRLHMNEAAGSLRRAAYLLENVVLAEKEHERDGVSVWLEDKDGVTRPLFA